MAAKLLREDDTVVYGDSGYLGIQKRDEIRNDERFSAIEYRINCRPGRLPRVSDNAIDWERYIENRKSAMRCKVEHPYRIVKNIFGFRKTVYRGLRKNLRSSTNRLKPFKEGVKSSDSADSLSKSGRYLIIFRKATRIV